jgi:hypothetical protein
MFEGVMSPHALTKPRHDRAQQLHVELVQTTLRFTDNMFVALLHALQPAALLCAAVEP